MSPEQARKIIATMFKTKRFAGYDFDLLNQAGPIVVPVILSELEHRDDQMTLCSIEHWNIIYTLVIVLNDNVQAEDMTLRIAKLMLRDVFIRPDDTSIREMLYSILSRYGTMDIIKPMRLLREKIEAKNLTSDYHQQVQEMELDYINEILDDFEE